jgi:hypothetical protein
VTSDLSGPESAYRFRQHLRVLYQPDHPDGGRIDDAFAPLWTLPLVTGVVGAAFSIIPAMVVVNWGRQRRAVRSEALQDEPDRTTGRGLRLTLGIVLTGGAGAARGMKPLGEIHPPAGQTIFKPATKSDQLGG